MFSQIAHKDKDQTSLLGKFGVPAEPEVIYPAQVMVKTSSGIKVLDLYIRNSNGWVYAKNGQYFISLMKSGITSNSKITWVELDGMEEVYDKCYLTYYHPMEGANEKLTAPLSMKST